MNIKVLGLVGLIAMAAPVAADAAPANGLTAHSYAAVTSPTTANTAAAPGDSTAKIENVWWRRGWGWRGGYGWRGYGWRGYGWRGPFIGYGYGWRRPYWRRRFYY